MKKNKIRHLIYKVFYQDIPKLGYSVAYITRLVSYHSDQLADLNDKYDGLLKRVDKIERNSE